MDFKSFSAIKQLSDSIDIISHQGMDILRLQHPLFEAAVALHGAHLLHFKPHNQTHDLIWMSEAAQFSPDKAIRGGVPVCWPWFGKVASPSHGFARTSLWELGQIKETDEAVTLTLHLNPTPETLSIWPHQFQCSLQFEFAEDLKISLDVKNTGQNHWLFSGALHTYLNIGDIKHALITGMGETYSDNLQANQMKQGHKLLGIAKEVDRVYTHAEPSIRLHDRLNKRTIVVTNQGDNSAVIWNPWKDLSHSMADMKDDSYQTMVCIEAAVHALSLEQGIKLAPGESHQLSTHICVNSH